MIDGEERRVKAGDVLRMPAGCRHMLLADTELQVIEVQLGKDIRYHYIYPEQQAAELVEMVGDGLLLLYQGDLQYIDFSYDVVDTVGDYLLLTVQN